MKKILVFLLIGLMMASTGALAQGKEKADAKKSQASQPVTHPQLAEILVKALGLVAFLPTAPTAQQMFDVLMQNGISPEAGWLLDAVVTKADLSRVIVQAMRKEDQVENPNDPQSWINLLKELGVSLDRLGETMQSVETLPEGMGQDVTLQSTDPLIYGVNFAPGSSVQYTVDLNLVTRVFSEIEMITGDFTPASPTPF
ncbi:MAG: hypothetical protein EOM72_07160 [Opitutae bacterium]|nr:hypothetical protein [Opitutae bacterium]